MTTTKQNIWEDYLKQQQKREKQLLSEVLECFVKHKKNTLEDLKVLKHNMGGLKK